MGWRRVLHYGEGFGPGCAVLVVLNTRAFRWLEGRSTASRSLHIERHIGSHGRMVTRTLHLLPLLLEEPSLEYDIVIRVINRRGIAGKGNNSCTGIT
jgi:hypothetical protein